MHNKKSQGISMNTIIIAAIALLVLVILAVIFTQRMGWWSRSSQDCEKVGGKCDIVSCTDGWIEHPSAVCDKSQGNYCCIRYDTSQDRPRDNWE